MSAIRELIEAQQCECVSVGCPHSERTTAADAEFHELQATITRLTDSNFNLAFAAKEHARADAELLEALAAYEVAVFEHMETDESLELRDRQLAAVLRRRWAAAREGK